MAFFIPPRWLRLKEAARYASIGQARLKRLVADGTIRGVVDPENARGDLVIDKDSIDEYWLSLMGSDPVRSALARFVS